MPRDDWAASAHSPLFGTSVRQPPTNLPAEMAVLGALLASNKTYERIAETLLVEHFADPINARIYKAISDRIIEGKIADCVTLRQDFEYSGILDEVGGTQYLSQLLASMVGILNAPDYARAIVDAAVRRQLIEIGQTIVDNAFGAEPLTDAYAQIDLAERDLANIRVDSKRRARTVTGGDAIAAAVRIAEDVHRSGKPEGVVVGLPTVDKAFDGCLGPGTLTLLAGLPGSGKAQPLDEPVLLADGTFKAMGEVVIGDALASIDGLSSVVTGIFPQGDREVIRAIFSDDRSTRVTADHLWRVHCKIWPAPRVLSTREVRILMSKPSYGDILWVDLCEGWFGQQREYPVDPYVLGVLLGDGCLTDNTVTFTSADPELVEEVRRRLGYEAEVRVSSYSEIQFTIVSTTYEQGGAGDSPSHRRKRRSIWRALDSWGLIGTHSHDKFVPPEYLTADRETRLDVLRGLMDTDGWAEKLGRVAFSSASERLARDVQYLVRSLGGLCWIKPKQATYTYRGERRVGRIQYMCSIRHPDQHDFFLLARKRGRARRVTDNKPRLKFVAMENEGREPTQCISVSHPSRLYLTNEFVATHNTALIGQMGASIGMRAVAEALADGKTWEQAARAPGMGLISMEMSAEQLGMRLAAAEAGMTVSDLRKGRLDLENTTRLVDAMTRTKHMAFRIHDMRRTPWRLLAPRIRLMMQRQRELIVAIDHLLVLGETPNPNGKNKDSGAVNASYVGWVTGQLKDLAEELGIAIVALTHTPRPQFGEAPRRPRASDVKWAGEGDADNVVFVHRPIMLMDSTPPARTAKDTDAAYAKKRELWHQQRDEVIDLAELVVAKQRMGPGGVFKMRWDGSSATLRELDE